MIWYQIIIAANQWKYLEGKNWFSFIVCSKSGDAHEDLRSQNAESPTSQYSSPPVTPDSTGANAELHFSTGAGPVPVCGQEHALQSLVDIESVTKCKAFKVLGQSYPVQTLVKVITKDKVLEAVEPWSLTFSLELAARETLPPYPMSHKPCRLLELHVVVFGAQASSILQLLQLLTCCPPRRFLNL